MTKENDDLQDFENRWKDADSGVLLTDDGEIVSFDRTETEGEE